MGRIQPTTQDTGLHAVRLTRLQRKAIAYLASRSEGGTAYGLYSSEFSFSTVGVAKRTLSTLERKGLIDAVGTRYYAKKGNVCQQADAAGSLEEAEADSHDNTPTGI